MVSLTFRRAFLAVIVATIMRTSFGQIADAFAGNPLVINSRNEDTLKLLHGIRQEVSERGCNVNVCFALQADDFITPREYFDQLNFVQLVAAVLNFEKNAQFAAVQYSDVIDVISPLTDRLVDFFESTDRAEQLGGKKVDIAAALTSCNMQLNENTGDANKIVLFSDGFESTGLEPSIVAEDIREDGTQICAVGVGAFSITRLEKIVGSRDKVTLITNFNDIFDIISSVVADICGSK